MYDVLDGIARPIPFLSAETWANETCDISFHPACRPLPSSPPLPSRTSNEIPHEEHRQTWLQASQHACV